MSGSPDERRRTLTARTMKLSPTPEEARSALAATRVLVVGAGGLGSPVVALLAGSGIGRITIIDPDEVDASNLSRQTLFAAGDVGRSKARLAAERAAAVDPDLDAVAVVDRFRPEMVAGHDVVLDAADSLAVTRSVSDACAAAGIPWVWGAVLGYDGQAAVFWDREGIDFHDLHPGAADGEGGTCALVGVLPSLCHAVGSVMAAQVLALVAHIGEPLLGSILSVDASTWEWTRSPLRRGPASVRPTAVPRIDVDALSGILNDQDPGTVVVDVRTPAEREAGSIDGSVPPDLVPAGATRLVVVCERGPRADAWAAANSTHSAGRVEVLDGGMAAWRAAGRPVSTVSTP